MNAQKVTIQEFKKYTKSHLDKHAKYLDKLAAINKAENAEIAAIDCEEKYKFSEYCKQFPEHVENYKKQRKELEDEYGIYSSYYTCPYYCMITTLKELDELYSDRMDDEHVKSENSSYNYHKRNFKKFVGKKLQNEIGRDIYGKCIGIAYFIDESYWCILDEQTNREEFCLHVRPVNIWDHRCWRIVENGRDYL